MTKHGLTNTPWEEHQAFVKALYADMSKMDPTKLDEFLTSRSTPRKMALGALDQELEKVQGATDARRRLEEAARNAKK